jgi:hypothetical protein
MLGEPPAESSQLSMQITCEVRLRLCALAGSLGPGGLDYHPLMEFLNFLIILATVYLVLRRPEKEGLAFRLLVTSVVLMVFVFLLGTRTSLLPPFNY